LEAYYSLGNRSTPIFVFDEVQDIKNFKQLVLQLYSQDYQLFISGSNSKLLSSELTTQFRGRIFQYFVYPLDFKEILLFNDLQVSSVYSSRQVGQIKNIFKQILKY
jgi:predicted AAA+ superfamily ATPase